MSKVLSDVIRVRTASARVQWLKEGVAEVFYAGVLTHEDFELLRAEVLMATCFARAVVLRMDATISALSRAVISKAGGYPAEAPPAALVCRVEDYALWSEYSRAAAERGVMRAVFLQDHLRLARVWAQRHALVRL